MSERLAAFVKQARACIAGGHFDDAVQFARQAVELAPHDPDALTALGAALSKAEMPQEATEALTEAVRLDPNSAKRRYNLATHYYRFGWKDEAKAELARALKLDPNYGKAKELLRRIELDRWRPPTKWYRTPDPSALQNRPPPHTSADGFQVWGQIPRKRHSFDFIERLGVFWDVILVSVFTAYTALMVVMIAEMISRSLDAAYQALSGTHAYGIVWLLFAVTWVMDLLDRRPSAQYVSLAVLGIVLTVPLCLLAFLPVLGTITFVVYLIGSRREARV